MRRYAAGLLLVVGLGCPAGDDADAQGSGPGSSGSDGTANPTGEGTGTGSETGVVDTGGSTMEADDVPDCPMQTYYPDVDMDGYGAEAYPVDACLQPPAHIPTGGDCDDGNPDVHPGVEELCDGVDNDCNGLVDEASPSNGSCQGCGLGMLGDHAYYYCPGPLSWAEARGFCMGFGADLVVIEDQAEQDFLLGQPVAAAPNYIGLSDEAVEGTFAWVDGTAPGFTAWGMGEPNDALEGEDCAQLAVPAGTWNDIACATAGAFVCEAAAG
ncbi:lectin-like protein [Paraliomyxa miuraensis]|uniref:lectin-like protein n=1 Tax=Paraliomyxa miuraensis TaxID=376150 RepID=UPI0022558116|nr:lectin-like protein [Paraliomyxa miuraensis]MCX4239323.1 MopE-related protein [Paraliomyxa miuraensis]